LIRAKRPSKRTVGEAEVGTSYLLAERCATRPAKRLRLSGAKYTILQKAFAQVKRHLVRSAGLEPAAKCLEATAASAVCSEACSACAAITKTP